MIIFTFLCFLIQSSTGLPLQTRALAVERNRLLMLSHKWRQAVMG